MISPDSLSLLVSQFEGRNQQDCLDEINFFIAHEVYHLYQLHRFPRAFNNYQLPTVYDDQSAYQAQRIEYSANLFAFSYMKSKLFEDWKHIMSRAFSLVAKSKLFH
jgi:hypothetical protein